MDGPELVIPGRLPGQACRLMLSNLHRDVAYTDLHAALTRAGGTLHFLQMSESAGAEAEAAAEGAAAASAPKMLTTQTRWAIAAFYTEWGARRAKAKLNGRKVHGLRVRVADSSYAPRLSGDQYTWQYRHVSQSGAQGGLLSLYTLARQHARVCTTRAR